MSIAAPPFLDPSSVASAAWVSARSAFSAAPRSLQGLVAVPLTVLDFLCVHPFADGNGRVARLLALMLLYQHGERVGRYVSLERIIEESKATYYESLERSSQGWHDGRHDAMPWLRYFWGTLTRAYRELEERVGRIEPATGKAERVRGVALRQTRAFTRAELLRECPGVSAELVRQVLRRLRDEGRLVVEGRGPGARWRLREPT